MLEKLRKINMRTAVFMGIIFYSLTILIHFLIISKNIPFTWVNGGRSESFAEQLPISIVNTVVSIIGVVFTLIVGRIKRYKYNRNHRYMLVFCCTLVFWIYTTIVWNTF